MIIVVCIQRISAIKTEIAFLCHLLLHYNTQIYKRLLSLTVLVKEKGFSLIVLRDILIYSLNKLDSHIFYDSAVSIFSCHAISGQ